MAAAPDIVEIKTPSEPKEEPPQFLGPHSIANLGERLLTALDSSFLTDVTIFVGDEAIKCHFNILSFASPKLAAILTEKEPRLPDMDPRHFRLLLQIIYTGGTTETQDVDTLLQLGREAHDLQVHAAVKFCADILAKKVNAENLWMIMGFANLIRSVNLKESCLEVNY
ncbi:hypothetical protein B566_EDAN009029 [Ephemera danica]|nr:hypothetical protein B566_EDAN009029 [Ephemera danica]